MKPTIFLFFDAEMTGLKIYHQTPPDRMIEAAGIFYIFEQGELRPLNKSFDQAFSLDRNDPLIGLMHEKVRQMHTVNGLLDKSYDSKVSIQDFEPILIEMLDEIHSDISIVLAGNTIHADYRQLQMDMPSVAKRIEGLLDITSVKLLAKMFYPGIAEYEKRETHTAFSDITESIQEMNYWSRLISKKSFEKIGINSVKKEDLIKNLPWIDIDEENEVLRLVITDADFNILNQQEFSIEDISTAQSEVLAFLIDNDVSKSSPLCGYRPESARKFLLQHMPAVSEFISYRNISIQSVEAFSDICWGTNLIQDWNKDKSAEEAINDIREYKTELFRDQSENQEIQNL